MARTGIGLATMLGANLAVSPIWARVGEGDEAITAELGAFAEFSIPERLFIAAAAGVTEEVTLHGYAIERLLTLTGSPIIAATVSFGAFTLSHLGETWSSQSALRIAQPALITTVLYLWFRSLPVLIAIHALNDAIGLLLAERFAEDE